MEANSERVMDFTPVDYDVKHMEPNCHPGFYLATVDKVKVSSFEYGGARYPLLIIDWRMSAVADGHDQEGEDFEKSIGAIVSDRIRFYPPGDKKGNIGKRTLQTLGKKLDVDVAQLLPASIGSKSDFDEIVEAFTNRELEVQVTHTQSADDPNQIFENIRYPRDVVQADASEEVEEAPRGRAAAKPAKKAAAGSRRR